MHETRQLMIIPLLMVEILETVVKVTQPRNDYKELLELTIIFCRTDPSYFIHVTDPGALHHTWWISKFECYTQNVRINGCTKAWVTANIVLRPREMTCIFRSNTRYTTLLTPTYPIQKNAGQL